ncbi:substrate-binding domain-containing protein [Haloarcula marismortui]|uniref:Periplasmic binding protein/LacI transcriptional regulator n=1 Tax=Haloarcula marismortui ATCC 33800 TaxID=662476 RepID=M0JM03_9EURY|nr:substrate-binding domain-containing protein [Haloarcula sinaiiensis]EMA10016.1 periplasmic binding protein/LacI transcriptional regulator [Haloarcula sinaiiensis ATCC 33800]QUJ74957.1 substrate-binding domain-containing protein [Haloarcula sinaiiensis ATCC 33800]
MSRDICRRTFIRSGALAGTALLAGCGGNGEDGSGGGDDGQADGDGGGQQSTSGNSAPSAALSVPSLEITFFARMENAFNEAKNQGTIASDSAFYDAGNSQSTQISDIETAISNEVDFIMVSAITAEGVINAIQEANEADIPVVAIDRNVAEGDTVSYIASDNVQLGQRSTELCLSFMQDQGDQDSYNVVQLEGTPGASVTNERGEGFQNAVSNNDSLNQLATQTGEFSTQNALSVMEDFITQYGDEIDGVFCQNDLMALGAHQALQNAGMSVPVTGIDGTEAWVQRFSDNEYYGTLAQLPEDMVNTSIERAQAHINGKDVEDSVVIEGLEVTQKNASDYLSQYFG